MKIILLAAGKGSRFSLKNVSHKCLIKINNKTLIENIILGFNNFKKILVTGYKRSILKKKLKMYNDLEFIDNLNYHKTEMLYSLMFALKKVFDDVLVSYTDILYDYDVINKLISKKSNQNYICIPILMNWKQIWKKRLNNFYSDLETLKYDKKFFLKEIGNKVHKNSEVMGQYMGIIYIPKRYKKTFYKNYNHNKWKKKHLTEYLNFLIKKKIKIKCLKYYGPWYEFDRISELRSYKKNFKNNKYN
jgi:choline kinase